MKKRRLLMFLLLAAMAWMTQTGHAEQRVDYNRDIRPLLSGSCLICHGPDEEERAAGLRLDTEDGSREDLGGYSAIVPGDASASEMLERLITDDEDLKMPPDGKARRFNEQEVELIRRWIDQGGEYAKHWSYIPPKQSPLPEIENSQWPINPIDHFILARLESEGMVPSPVADRLTIARRVSLDLTGLPPTWAEASRFVHDPSENAYENYVDRLLAQPAFGERWAHTWLDLARYADSAGYADDPPRTIWAYRDYVIRSLNENKPFDQFTIEQIAGDLLDNPTEDQLIATAFHRNTTTNSEGGTNDEEFRNAAVVDRVNTTMAVWMGTTIACAQCHTHKYDPITHEDYFSFFAFFNNTEDADRRDERPIMEIWTDAQIAEKTRLQTEVKQQQSALDQLTTEINSISTNVTRDSATRFDRVDNTEGQWQLSVNENQVLTGLRLEVPQGEELSFSPDNISLNWSPNESETNDTRYVRIELPGKGKMIHLAELQVFGVDGGVNIALGSTATQSSTGFGGTVDRVIDGNTDGDFQAGSVTHTNVETDPWLELDLGKSQNIKSLAIWNRTDGGESMFQRLTGFRVSLLDENRETVWSLAPPEPPSPSAVYNVDGGSSVSFVALPTESDSHSLTLALARPIRDARGVLSVEFPDSVASDRQIIPIDHERMTAWAEQTAKFKSLDEKLASLTPSTSVPVMRELPEKQRRESHVHLRGSYLSHGPQVHARTPLAFHPLNDDEVSATAPDRMSLARWLVADDNPLTPRVIANRHWEQIFGVGLVETSEEFGTQGELPSHPELLDFLGVQLRDHGWDLKRLLRLIVTSATYRQSSMATDALIQADPANRLLARGPRFRASAEIVRDQALFVSGLLSPKMYGPPVQPLQPDLGLKAAFGSATDWKTSAGTERYRRGLYTMWRRSSPYPSMAQFDAPNREVCTVRRIRTNTPLQALVTLNDPVYVEAAQALARRIVDADSSTRGRIEFAFRESLLRDPTEPELTRLSSLREELVEYYEQRSEDAEAMATHPLGPVADTGSDAVAKDKTLAELAAWTVMSNVILNLDEWLMKR